MNKSRISVALLVAITLQLLIVGCSHTSSFEDQLSVSERLVECAPDSAEQILEELTAQLPGRMNKCSARATLLLARTRLKQGKSFVTVENFDDALNCYETVNDSSALLEMYRLAAMKMLWRGDRDSAVYYLKNAINVSTVSTVPTKSQLYIELSHLYARPSISKNYDEAIDYARKALINARTAEDRAQAMHDIGFFYSMLERNDSAVIFMENALAEIDPSSELYAQFALNYANTPMADFRKGIAYLNATREESLGRLITLGFLYLNNSDRDSARIYFTKSDDLFNENSSKYSINTYNSLRLLGQSLGLLNTGKVAPCEATLINDSISELSAIGQMISEERREYNDRLRINLLKQTAHRRLQWIISLSLCLVMSLVFIVYVWYSKRRYTILKQKLDNIKCDQIVVEANGDGSGGEMSVRLIRQRMEICIEQFKMSKLQSDIDRMELQYRSTGEYPSMKCREQIQKKLIGCFADFIVDLKMSGTKLSIDDIVTCVMSCVRMSNAAVAACLGVTDNAVRTRKSRLRTKLPDYILELLDL